MIGTVLQGRYQVTGELGRGGMGVVYKGLDPLLRREVAIKMISPTLVDADAERRIEAEAQIVARLEHPAIVPIHDMGRHGEVLYVVMPLVTGQTLRTLVDRGELRLGEILEIGVQAAQALGYSHRQGVIHRDIKPSNLLVSRQGRRTRLRILDFGLARRYDQEDLTRSTRVAGTLAYLSPELVESGGKVSDERSDLYALGAVLYECLASEPPFTGSLFSTLYRIVHEPARGLRDRGVEVDEELEGIILACLEKDPAARPASGKELAGQLARFRDQLAESEWARRTAVSTASLPRQAGSAPSEPLVGRGEELEQLEERLARALTGECGLTLVAGDAGTGKTRLIQELVHQARARLVLVLQGRYSELETTFTHQALCELVEDFFRGGEASRVEGPVPDLSDLAGDLVALYPALAEIPELRRALPASAGAPSGQLREETWIFELLAKALSRLSGGRPMVIVLEDLHAGDSGLEALHYLVRRLGPSPTLVIGSFRPAEVDRGHPLTRVLESFRGDPRFLRLDLGPLDPRGTRQLAESLLGGPALDAGLVEKLWQATEGNPLFCRELVRALVESGALVQDDLGLWTLTGAGILPDALPATLRQAEERRLEHLPDAERRMLGVAAVLGRSFEVADLQSLLGEDAGDEALDRLLERGLLREARKSRGQRLVFTSGIVRDLLEQELTRRRRRRLHESVVRLLERRWSGQIERVLPRLVEHCRAADLPEETVRYALELARRSLATSSPEDAVRAARVALDFAEDVESADGATWLAEATAVLAEAWAALGDGDKALRYAEQAADRLSRLGDAAGEAAASVLAADVAWRGRRMDDVKRWVSRGMEAARGGVAPAALDRLSALGITVANLHGERSEALYLEEVRVQELRQPTSRVATVPGGQLVSALPYPPHSIDPSRLLTMEEWEIAGNVYEPLLGSDEHGLLVPRLCESWRASTDFRHFTFQLRPDLRLSDGSRLDAMAVKLALERAARWRGGEPPPAFAALEGIESYLAGEVPHIAGIEVGEAADSQRLLFHLRQTLPIFPALLTDLRTAIAKQEAGALLGTGPFRLATVDSGGRRWYLERNPHWRGEAPSLDGIEFRVLGDPWATGAALRSGEVDLAGDLVAEDLEELVRRGDMRRGLVETVKRNTYFVLMRRHVPSAVRRAMHGVVRVRDLVWRTIGRYAVPAAGLVPPGLLGHDASRERPVLSVDRAREMLDAAGVERPFEVRAAVHPLFHERFAPLLRELFDLWAEIGIELQPSGRDMAAFRAAWRSESTALMIGRWGAAYEDADNFTHNLLNSRTGLMRGYFSSADADLLLERARLETRPMARAALYRRFETLLDEQSVLLPLFHEVDYRLLSPEWTGLRLSSTAPYVDYTRIARRRDPESVEQVAGELRLAQVSIQPTLDPAALNQVDHHELVRSVFEPLVRIDEQARVEPWLAESIEPQMGGRAFRIRLRRDVRFHDGRHLTSRDVRYSLERLLRGESDLRYLTTPLRGAEEVAEGRAEHLRGVIVHSQGELTLELQRAMPTFPALLAHPGLSIVPEGCGSFTGTWQDGCLGTGPFRVAAFEPGRGVELERHPLYWRAGLPKVERLVVTASPDPTRRLADFEAGRLALLADLPPIEAERLRRRPGRAVYHETPGLVTYFLAVNCRRGPLVDPALRATLLDALGAEAAVRALGRLALPASSLVPPGLLGYEPARERRRADLEDRHQVEGLSLRLAWHPIFEERYVSFKESLLERLAEVGVEVEGIACDLEELRVHGQEGSVDLLLSRWAAVYPDADCFFTGLLSRRGGFLAGLLARDDIEALIAEGRAEGDPALRHGTYRRLEDLIAQERLLEPLFHEQIYRFAQPQVEGLRLAVTAPQVRYDELSLT